MVEAEETTNIAAILTKTASQIHRPPLVIASLPAIDDGKANRYSRKSSALSNLSIGEAKQQKVTFHEDDQKLTLLHDDPNSG